MLHHLDLNVSDLAQSSAFYGALLPRLGYHLGEVHETWLTWRCGSFYLTLVQAEERFRARGFHRKQVGVNHLAFTAPSRAAVDQLFQWLVETGVSVLYGGPLDMGAPEAPNYAVFFEDPDRLKLEYVYTG
jgi:catechol 2,3-dioxygenase-like lactoylglutathione lyase family enzyme